MKKATKILLAAAVVGLFVVALYASLPDRCLDSEITRACVD